MIYCHHLSLLTLFWLAVSVSTLLNEADNDNDYNRMKKEGNHMNLELNSTASFELLDKWLSQAVSGLMAAVASKKLEGVEKHEKERIQTCSKMAKDVPMHAKCVVKLLDAHKIKKERVLKRIQIEGSGIRSKNDTEWIGSFGLEREKRDVDAEDDLEGLLTQRVKRESEFKIITKDKYELHMKEDEDAMTRVVKGLTNTVRVIKNKDKVEKWREAIGRVRKLSELAKAEKKKKDDMKEHLRKMINNSPSEFLDPRKPIALKQAEIEEQKEKEADMMKKEQTEQIRVPLRFLRKAVKMALELGGQNVTDFEKKTLKMVSPRMMSVMPEQEDDSLFNLLSPSLFSLHDEGEGLEKLTSLPALLKKLDLHGQEAWMDFIIEAAGVTDQIDMAEEKLRKRREKELIGEGGTPLYFTKENATKIVGDVEKRKIEVFEKLDKSYTDDQKEKLNNDGYALLTKEQLNHLYGEESPYHHEKALKRFRRLRDEPEKYIERDIRAIAEADKFQTSRRKDVILSPFVFASLTFASAPLSNTFIVLSPIVFSPVVLSPAVLGPIILSPWVFIPLILSPRILSPLIVTPLIFSPIVLSPLILHPLILVPGIFNPFVLSPLVLTPFILSPQVFTPLILSPFVLNPLILTPMVGSPLVLSPFVLSPIIGSPQALFAVVLSPYVLSPLVESKLIAAEVVLSPSFLS